MRSSVRDLVTPALEDILRQIGCLFRVHVFPINLCLGKPPRNYSILEVRHVVRYQIAVQSNFKRLSRGIIFGVRFGKNIVSDSVDFGVPQ